MGNRTRAETITAGATQLTNYTYNSANQLMSDGTQLFSYDANGRLTSAGDRSYSYALNDRLITLSQPGLSATFAYNGDGVRLAQTENGSETRYLVDTQRGYSEVVGAITPESETWYLLGLDVLGQQQGSDWSYYAYDGLGSVRLALDSSGSPSAGMRYEPYGLPAASWGTPPALGFTGEWTDSSGLLYLRARYLDPSSATFLSRDPFEGLPTRALSRNGYAWVEGNPVSRSDPSGLCWDHPMSTGAQRSQCLQAWVEYASTVLLTDETRQLLRDEDEYWGSLSYTEFARLWNDNQARPPSRTNPGSEWEQLTWAAVGAAVATGPTPDDLAWLAGALCLEALRQIALARAIALPQRWTFDFSLPRDDAGDDAIPIPIPYPDDFDSCISGMPSCSSLEAAGGRYYGFDDAVNALTSEYPNAVERECERETTVSGHCPGIGSHSQFYDDDYAGSITCCPCCDESVNLPDVRCFIRWPH